MLKALATAIFSLFTTTIDTMALAAALATTQTAIDAIPNGGLANGQPYANTAMPSTSHIRDHLKWPLTDTGASRSLVDHICRYARVELDTAGHAAATAKADIEVAVIIAVARAAAWRYYGWGQASLNAAETVVLTAATPDLAVHADHQDAVTEALAKWSTVGARYMGLFFYNSISYETSSHHHLPATTKKLASTTIVLSGLKEWMAGDHEKEGSIFHDMFHPLSDTMKSNAARNVGAREHLSDLKFDNLRKRIPVKAPDSGIAINYPVLLRKARAYRHAPTHIPSELDPPANVATAIADYEGAANAAALTAAVTRLRRLSEELAEPSAYLAGFILGREANAAGDHELDLRTAARTTTILGSPAYARAAGEFSGSFAAGKESGMKNVPANTPDQVLPRCTTAVARAAAL